MPVITGAAKYPENLVEKMKATGAKVDALDCLALAEQAGSSKAVNIVLMGPAVSLLRPAGGGLAGFPGGHVPPKFWS